LNGGFHRPKDAPLSISPLYVPRDDQVTGLIHLLRLAVRVLSVIECVVRRQLAEPASALVYQGHDSECRKHPI
jgi:transposase